MADPRSLSRTGTFDVYDAPQERDASPAHLGAIPISPQQREHLHAGATITIAYHTPRMLRAELGPRNGQFEVLERDGRLIVSDAEQVKQFIALQADIARVMKEPDKWTDPDAESDSPIR